MGTQTKVEVASRRFVQPESGSGVSPLFLVRAKRQDAASTLFRLLVLVVSIRNTCVKGIGR